jgi:putative ABC transport system permease protein
MQEICVLSRGQIELTAMSLVLTLASRNLFQDKLRFVATMVGIVFSVVLVMVQTGLYTGFGRMVTAMTDHASVDLWVVSRGAKSFEDITLLDTQLRDRVRAINGVADVTPLVIGFSDWRLPDGAMTPVFVVGSDLQASGLVPWNLEAGTVRALTGTGAVAIDRTYYDRLGVSGIGSTAEIRGHPVRVAAVTDGIRSFTTTPYVFADLAHARSYTGLPESKTSHFIVHVKPAADINQIRQEIASTIPGVEALTPEQFSQRGRSFWLFGTGAGFALFAGALLGVIVGTVIVAQTLYSSTKDHLYEFAMLRAIGCSKSYIYGVIICQALLNAVIGFGIAGVIGAAVVKATAATALPIVITPNLVIGLFCLTVAMCVASALAAIVRVVRIEPVMVLSR